MVSLQKQLKASEEALAQKDNGKRLLKEEVTEADIAEIISKWTGERNNAWVSKHRHPMFRLAAGLRSHVSKGLYVLPQGAIGTIVKSQEMMWRILQSIFIITDSEI